MAWEVLTPERIQRKRRERQIPWPCSLRVRMRFRALLAELVDLETEPDSYEVRNAMEVLRDEIRSLPGFPRAFDPERDIIVPTTTSAQR